MSTPPDAAARAAGIRAALRICTAEFGDDEDALDTLYQEDWRAVLMGLVAVAVGLHRFHCDAAELTPSETMLMWQAFAASASAFADDLELEQ